MWRFIGLQPVNHLHCHCDMGKYEHMDWLHSKTFTFVVINKIVLCCVPSEEDEERWRGDKWVHQHQTWRGQETLQSLTAACRYYKNMSQLLKLFQCRSQTVVYMESGRRVSDIITNYLISLLLFTEKWYQTTQNYSN